MLLKNIIPLALKICGVRCIECREPLTDEEIAEATKEELKHPIRNDCYHDWISDRYEEQRNPDEPRGRYGR